ncbi:MAG TPA: c-type cytochrome [Aromatoleum sp.]|uniref:c-type cytochrome n=1 Tax=Aromatoleum sp. TaxID=2307007 RepID=UPI002B49D47B|nr:c-type cytochrome [Aromatoleum sp.]HJV24878.1 c-type cytochrome [Aromatoleum sp.]
MGFRGRLAVIAVVMAACSNALAGDTVQDLIHKAASDSPTHAALVKEGHSASFFCANCHGESGASRYPEVPNLAGQNPVYVANQISAFVSGKRRNEFMQGLMKVLSDREKAAIAVYFADAGATPAGKGGAAAVQGESHFKRICVRCHQADAHGNEGIPRLAGQQPEYLRLSLKRYLNKTGERVSTDMSAAAAELGEANIEAVVQYLAGLK